ncbi:hypothetical protein D0T08_09860 [Emticicia sp. C21]|nr:hypothetical protein D0T08_09860 [Emticicia sp. C21]
MLAQSRNQVSLRQKICFVLILIGRKLWQKTAYSMRIYLMCQAETRSSHSVVLSGEVLRENW